jgi:predicted small lipoprotein YifL
MLNVHQILVSARARAALMVCLVASGAALVACGQRGPLFLPSEAAAAHRATLPQLLRSATPGGTGTPAQAAPAPAAAASAAAAAVVGAPMPAAASSAPAGAAASGNGARP